MFANRLRMVYNPVGLTFWHKSQISLEIGLICQIGPSCKISIWTDLTLETMKDQFDKWDQNIEPLGSIWTLNFVQNFHCFVHATSITNHFLIWTIFVHATSASKYWLMTWLVCHATCQFIDVIVDIWIMRYNICIFIILIDSNKTLKINLTKTVEL